MRGKFVKIERPKGYVNIDEICEALGGIEKEEDYEYGDYGEVLSKWATCDYGDVLEAIYCCNIVKAVTLDRIREAREEIDYLPTYKHEIHRTNSTVIRDVVEIDKVMKILNKLAESED